MECGNGSSPTTPAMSPSPEAKPPAVPTNLHVSASGADFIEWSWDTVPNAEGYEVQFSAEEYFDTQDDVVPRSVDQTFYRRHPLPTGTNAHLRVRSVAGAGEDRLTGDWSTGVVGTAATPRTGRAHFFTCSQASPFQWFVAPGDVLALEWTVSFIGFPDDAFVKEGTAVLREKEWNEYVVTEKAHKTAGIAEIHDAAGRVCNRLRFAVGLDPRRDLFASSPKCEATRVAGLSYGARLVHEWTPDHPIGFDIETDVIRQGGIQLGAPDFLEDQVLEPLREFSQRIKERLGYPILGDPYRRATAGSRIRVVFDSNEPGSFNVIHCEGYPDVGSAMNAVPDEGLTRYNRHFFDPEIQCPGYRRARTWSTVVHEVGHLLGMTHNKAATGEDPALPGVEMSRELTFMGPGDWSQYVTPQDLDAIGCIFPHPNHPR